MSSTPFSYIVSWASTVWRTSDMMKMIIIIIHHNNDHVHCSGPEERVCQATGMWSNQEPYCKKKGWHSDNHQDDDSLSCWMLMIVLSQHGWFLLLCVIVLLFTINYYSVQVSPPQENKQFSFSLSFQQLFDHFFTFQNLEASVLSTISFALIIIILSVVFWSRKALIFPLAVKNHRNPGFSWSRSRVPESDTIQH